MSSEVPYRIRLQTSTLERLRECLFPDDGAEALAFALCCKARTPFGTDLLVREVVPLPGSAYRSRSGEHVVWSTEALLPLLDRLADEQLCLLKCHSHPGGESAFSITDDLSDRSLLPHCYEWNPDGPHGSLVLNDTHAAARIVSADCNFFEVDKIWSIGHRWELLTDQSLAKPDPVYQRLRQAFGEGTYTSLQRLRVGVVGASGTGSLVIEALARSGVGQLILVDPEPVEQVNLNRVLHSTPAHVEARAPKVAIADASISDMQFGTRVTTLIKPLQDPLVIRTLAGCDVLLGCVDNREARQLLCRLAAYYLLPFLDTGVAIHATENGDIQSVSAAVHYFQPGQSFLSRGVFDEEALRAESLARTDPDHHAAMTEAGYIHGVQVERPAVMPLNMIASGWMVMELLERIHGYRDDSQRKYLDETYLSVDMGFTHGREDTQICPALKAFVGRGDTSPLLGLPALSASEDAA
ncbi:MAG: ThiF family adenylyltransferase [Candidatus Thiodiazotropha sp. (ex Lucina aurantia)]|nr:ThiF family adenylyltransferase [Candidatus Thiodiazotropha taylori]MBV2098752.1 ThiF family adenylyltransferase [Candidatus Thiodiazotropha sp. (ex Codakia orbicularis)]MBV2103672.1 ThiF family adenylyltransferase [Candidatus Thiodiazotropha sp. (ex Lucina aurantia)]MBV2118111.1 ThiF family adenylyltransferase [Candidatus Thiodiazotropha sp. (ex Lucina aurantia)]